MGGQRIGVRKPELTEECLTVDKMLWIPGNFLQAFNKEIKVGATTQRLEKLFEETTSFKQIFHLNNNLNTFAHNIGRRNTYKTAFCRALSITATELGMSAEASSRICFARMEHKTTALTIARREDELSTLTEMANQSFGRFCDAILTNNPNIVLAIPFADCPPIVFYDVRHHALALAHAGWKSLLGMGFNQCIHRDYNENNTLSIIHSVLRAMQYEYGSEPNDLRILIGPHISKELYLIEYDRVNALQACNENCPQFPLSLEQMNACFYRPEGYSSLSLDLSLAIQLILENQGVKPSQMFFSQFHTGGDDKTFTSARRDTAHRSTNWILAGLSQKH